MSNLRDSNIGTDSITMYDDNDEDLQIAIRLSLEQPGQIADTIMSSVNPFFNLIDNAMRGINMISGSGEIIEDDTNPMSAGLEMLDMLMSMRVQNMVREERKKARCLPRKIRNLLKNLLVLGVNLIIYLLC